MDTPHNRTQLLHKTIRHILRWCRKTNRSVEDFFRRYTLECYFEMSEPVRLPGGGVRLSGTETQRFRERRPDEALPAVLDIETIKMIRLISLFQQHPELEEILL